jgi:hypothetical protein
MFVPQKFVVPESFITDRYRLEMLSPSVAEIDYDAVMTSKVRLRTVFSEKTEWPKDDMSLEENRRDLKRHEIEFKSRQAFAYTVLTLLREKCIGCVYIDPSTVSEFDCEVYLWVRESDLVLDSDLYNNIRNWLMSSWPFKSIAFPGREISWDKWKLFLSKR